MNLLNKTILAFSILVSFVASAGELKINSKTCELTLLDSMRSGSLYPSIEDALEKRGFKINHVRNERFSHGDMQVGDLWAIGSAACDIRVTKGLFSLSTEKDYCSATMVIDIKTDNGGFKTIFWPSGSDSGFANSKAEVDELFQKAITNLIKTIPTCIIVQ